MQGVIKIALFYILIVINIPGLFSQTVYVNASNKNIYEFLDELANDKIITINSTIKPYSRKYILVKLKEANKKIDELTIRQLEELEFYLKDYGFDEENNVNPLSQKAKLNIFKKHPAFCTSLNPLGFFYKDSLFTFSIRPIWGTQFYINKNDTVRHTWGGAEAYAYIGKHLGLYASLRDNQVTKMLNFPTFYTQIKGGSYQPGKSIKGGADFNEMIGGITWSWNWGEIGLIKDNIIWGDNYHGSNIFSGRTPSFAMVKLHLNPVKWFDFNYHHGWLISEVEDNVRSYITSNGDNRIVYRKKYIAANMFTITPFKGINVSLGNSIIYSDMDFHPAYLIPIFFYKSVDHTLNHNIDNQNSQMYGSLSVRLVKHWHFYTSVYIDELQLARVTDKNRHNFYSYKIGSRLTNWPVKNIALTGEYTHSNPIAYKHRVPTLTFESNQYNLGHYLRDNSEEIYVELLIKPVSRMKCRIYYLNAKHGNEYQYIFNQQIRADEYPLLKDITWKNESISLNADYEFLNNCYVFIQLMKSNIQGFDVDNQTAQYYLNLYTPEIFQRDIFTFIGGINFGF
ncbi:MAG: hypothetical protein JXB17_09155 [Bacteroidales bacterium]|nr:hypothetical protein [Bacteroidales bacterium]